MIMKVRRTILRRPSTIIAGSILLLFSVTQTQPYNVLFIAIDDLRPQLKVNGKEFMVTPNLDKLSEEGILFNNHYVQVTN